jgi:hypothetical protein
MDARDALDSVGVPVYRVRGPGPVRREHGFRWSGGANGNAVKLLFSFVPQGRWTAEVETRQQPLLESVVVAMYMFGKDVPLTSGAPTFPVISTVHKSAASIRIEDEEHLFTVYACGKETMSVAKIADRWVYPRCQKALLPKLILGTERRADLRRFIARAEARDAKRRANRSASR